jgi:hypothetical protein
METVPEHMAGDYTAGTLGPAVARGDIADMAVGKGLGTGLDTVPDNVDMEYMVGRAYTERMADTSLDVVGETASVVGMA